MLPNKAGQPRARYRLIALLMAALASATAIAAERGTPSPRYSAEAVHTANPDQPVEVTGQPNLFVAATAALQQCGAAFAQAGHCELTRINDQTITQAATIKSRIPNDRHPLYIWQYRSPTATVYLAGSVHIMKQSLYPLPPQLTDAFAAADRLVLEVDVSQYTAQQLQNKLMQYGLLGGGQTLDQVLSPDLYTRLDAYSQQYGLPLAQLAPFKPAFVVQQMGVLALTSLGYDPSTGIEQYLSDQASGKTIMELESIDQQLDLLMNQPMDVQVQMVKGTLQELTELEPLLADLMAAWFTGDDHLFQTTFEAQSGTSELSAQFMRELMDQRNIGMATKIKRYLAGQGTYLVVIGTAHFIGDQGIISLLDEQGIGGRRIYSDDRL